MICCAAAAWLFGSLVLLWRGLTGWLPRSVSRRLATGLAGALLASVGGASAPIAATVGDGAVLNILHATRLCGGVVTR